MIYRLMEFSRKHPYVILIILVVGSIFSGLQVGKLWIDTSIESFLVVGDPDINYHHETIEKFGSDIMMIIYVEDDALFSVQKLMYIESLVYDLNAIPGINRVESLFSVSNLKGEGGYLSNNPFMDGVPESDEQALRVKVDAVKNPILIKNLISSDGRKTAINLYLEPVKGKKRNPYKGVLARISECIDAYKEHFHMLFELGSPYTRDELASLVALDMRTLLVLAFIVLLVMLIITLGSLHGALLPFLTAGFSIFFTLGFMSFIDLPINLVTFIIPVLVIVVGSTEDIHILSEYEVGLRKERDRKLAIRFVATSIGTTLLMTSLTTFLGFASISINMVVALVQFGIASGFALFINPLITVMLAPVFLAYFGSKRTKKKSKKENLILKKIVKTMTDIHIILITKKRWLTILVFLVVSVVSIIFIFRIRVDNNTVNYFKQDNPILERINIMHKELSGTLDFRVRISSTRKGTFKDPRYLSFVNNIQEKMDKEYEFDKTISIADYVKLIHKEMNNGDDSFYSIPDSQDLIEQYSIFLHRDEIQSFINYDWSEACIVVRHNISSSEMISKTCKKLEADIAALHKILEEEEIRDTDRADITAIAGEDDGKPTAELSDEELLAEIDELLDMPSGALQPSLKGGMYKEISIPAIRFKITGEGILFSKAANVYIRGQVFGICIVLAAIFIIMMILFTNIIAGLISLVPNIFPIIIFFGIMGLFDIPLNIGTCMIAVVCIGIAVDDTIHLMTRYNIIMRRLQNKTRVIQEVMKKEIKPVFSTSIALTLSFSILAFANVLPIIFFGVLSAIGMVFALLADLFITPILLTNVPLINISDIISMKLAAGLKNAPLFSTMSTYQIKKFILLCKIEQKEEGEHIIRYGELDQNMYLLLKGKVRVVRPSTKGKKAVELDVLGVGNVFGEISLIRKVPRTADVIAREPVIYLMIDRKGLEKIQKSSKLIAMKLYFNLTNIMGKRLTDTVGRLISKKRK